MERGRRARPPAPLVYVNSFGSHRCGSVIRLGRGCGHSPGRSPPGRGCGHSPGRSPPGRAGPSAGAGGSGRRAGSGGPGRAGSRTPGDLQEAKADTFDFPVPPRSVDKAIKRKKKKSKVWHKVWKVISKMLEENEKFRRRLLTCSQFDGEGGVHLWLGVARKYRKIQPKRKYKSSESFYFDLVLPEVSGKAAK